MGLCVSDAQCAFVPGRDISENVVLLREVLHCFKMRGYNKQQFCLKADLSKAFDRLDWNYLEELLPLYGFPPLIVSWILTCVKSAEFTLILNGRGDGFFKPRCGLRQGCTLSPYLFILGMDLLSRQLQWMVSRGGIQGVKVARTAPAITNCLYADDLLLFGEASVMEAEEYNRTLQEFSAISGQQVGHAKSFIWFSSATNPTVKEQIEGIFHILANPVAKNYLGAPIETNAAAYDFLIERFCSKLQMWKSRLLSQSGRVVLIK